MFVVILDCGYDGQEVISLCSTKENAFGDINKYVEDVNEEVGFTDWKVLKVPSHSNCWAVNKYHDYIRIEEMGVDVGPRKEHY